jgi:hypothetical protein
MSHNDSIISMLNLKEKNIFFKENFARKKLLKELEQRFSILP